MLQTLPFLKGINGFWRLRLPVLLFLPALLHSVSGLAAQVEHEHLATSELLTFQAMFDSALAHSPEYLETPVRERQAGEFAATGKSWIAGRPSVQLNYFDDSTHDNLGQTELEYGVQLPLWRPGQRRDTRALGEQYEDQVDTWKQALVWSVAGRLRQSLAALAEADLGLRLQNRAVEDASQLRDVTMTLFEAGEVARLELMQAESLLVEKQADLLQAEASMVDAERTYSVLTGLNVRPLQAHSETLIDQEEITEDHPQLRYLRSSVNLAGANIQQSENAARGNPTLTIGTRTEKADRFQDSLSSIGVQLSIPFGGGSFVSAQTSSARRSKVNAEVSYQNAYIVLNQELHEVEHDLFVLGQQEPLRRAQSDLSRQRFEMALTAFEVGETTLAQTVTAQQGAQESDFSLQMLLLERERLITEFNQLIGVLP
jgi:outer membrane protein, heavy metal efflux system